MKSKSNLDLGSLVNTGDRTYLLVSHLRVMDLELTTVNPIAHKSDIECAATVVSSGDSESTTNTAKRDKGYWRRSSFYRRRDEHGNDFQITVPWSPQMYFSVRGAENFHIYLWILKDLAWTQKWYGMSWTFGILAISWIFVLAYHAFNDRNFNEIYMLIAMVLWLSANFVWMAGELLYAFVRCSVLYLT